MSFQLKIIGEITWSHSLEALFNQFNNMVLSSSHKSVPAETCKHPLGERMGSIQDYSTTSSLQAFQTFFIPFTTSMETAPQ